MADDMTFRPQWQGQCEAYARIFARDNHHRVRHLCYDREDTFQYCAMVWAWCCKVHDDRVDSQARFMAFFQKVLENEFKDLVRLSKAQKRTAETEPFDVERHQLSELPTAPLLASLTEASRDLRQVLEVIGTAPSDLLQLLLPDRLPRDEASLSRSWCRLARTATVRNDLLSELRMRIAQ